jgi:hypothetical protein
VEQAAAKPRTAIAITGRHFIGKTPYPNGTDIINGFSSTSPDNRCQIALIRLHSLPSHLTFGTNSACAKKPSSSYDGRNLRDRSADFLRCNESAGLSQG